MASVVQAPRSRSRLGYAVFPRLPEVAVKGGFVPVAYGVCAVTSGSGVSVSAAVAVWVAFELGVYQLRYMVNDLLDRADDSDESRAGTIRGRMPETLNTSTIALVAAVRVGAVAAVTVLSPPVAARSLLAGAGAVVLAAVVYEALRNRTGRRSSPPGPSTIAVRALWFWVGVGYGIRLAVGGAMGGASWRLLVVVFISGVLFGSMFVVQTWTLEAAGHAAAGNLRSLAVKPHVAALADPGSSPRRPLLSGPTAKRASRFAIPAVLSAGVLGHWLHATPSPWLVAAVVVLALASAAVVDRLTNPWLVVAGVTCVAIAITAVPGTDHILVRLVPVTVYAMTAFVFAVSDPTLIGLPSSSNGSSDA